MHLLKLSFAYLWILVIVSTRAATVSPGDPDEMLGSVMGCALPMLCDLGLKEELHTIFKTHDEKTSRFMIRLMQEKFPDKLSDILVDDVYTDEFWEKRIEEVLCGRFTTEEERKHLMKEIAEPSVKYCGDVCINPLRQEECEHLVEGSKMYNELCFQNWEHCENVVEDVQQNPVSTGLHKIGY